MPLPFDGAISAFFEETAPSKVRSAIQEAAGKTILEEGYPYPERMDKSAYDRQLVALQTELAKLQAWVQSSGERVVIVFEGRDAAGKGGTIKRFREHLNPRVAGVVALSKPTDRERSSWYFQRYLHHLPAGGELRLFDRSWYNRGVVEHVFSFCTKDERARFFAQVPSFERMVVDEGIRLFKLWLTVGQAEQLNRMLARERDPLKQWKLSKIDVDGLHRWNAYTEAITETLGFTHSPHAPWTVIRADDKRRARLEAIRTVLTRIDYAGKDDDAVGNIDPSICGGPALIHA